MTLPGSPLCEDDFAALAAVGIPRELAQQACLRRVSTIQGAEIVGRNGSGDYAGIVFPNIWPGDKIPREYRLRRDKPELTADANGKLKERNKYLSPPGRGNHLYFVPETPADWLTDVSIPVVVTEGEKKALALYGLSWHARSDSADRPRFLPIGVPGVWNWWGTIGKASGPDGSRRDIKGPIPDLDRVGWSGRHVLIVFDANVRSNDGVRAARDRLAGELGGRGATVLYVELPEVPGVNGIDDLVGVWGHDRVLTLLDGAARPRRESGSRPESQATELLNLAKQQCKLYHTPDQDPFVEWLGDPHEVWRVRSSGFRQRLTREYFRDRKKAPSAQAIEEAVRTIESLAIHDGDERKLHMRVARSGDSIYLDLCDRDWRSVEISPSGWRVIRNTSVAFRRESGMQPLPVPITGRVSKLRRLMNLESDDDWALCLGWLVGTLRPEGEGPYPILALHGEEGSAKSTATIMLKQMVDPSHVPLRSLFREERDLAIAAKRSWVLPFDNASELHPWQSDVLCRVATGAGFSIRKLHTDDDEVLFKFSRPVILNGIPSVTDRADLASRAIVIELPYIPKDKRRLESDLWLEYRRLQPEILGGLCDAVAEALRNLPTVKLPELPRMADFAVFVAAAEPALDLERGKFIRAYAGNRQSLRELTIEGDDVARAVREFIRNRGGKAWTGSATQLLKQLLVFVDEQERQHFAKNGSGLSKRLIRAATVLRADGLDLRRDRGRDRTWTIRRTAEFPVAHDVSCASTA